MSRASYKIEVGWQGATIGQFVIGASLLNSADTFGQSFNGSFDGPYADVTSYTKSMTWTRGRTDDLGPIQAGGATLVLADLTGIFNPANPSSPIYPNVTPLRPVRVTATFQSASYILFAGFIRSIEHDPDPSTKTSTIECVDLFVWLQRAKPTIALTGQTTITTAVGLILDAIGWTEPTLRSLQGNDVIPNFSTDGTNSALDVIGGFFDVDPGGMFFVNGAGVACYRSRHILMLEASVATFDQNMVDLAPGSSLDAVQNRAAVTRTGGVEQVAQNAASILQYGYSDTTSIESPYLVNDDQALGLATFLTTLHANPLPPLYSLTLINGSDANLTQILTRELADRITVPPSAGVDGTAGDFIIQQLNHSVTDGGAVHTCQMVLGTRYAGPAPIVFDTTLMDSTPAVLIY